MTRSLNIWPEPLRIAFGMGRGGGDALSVVQDEASISLVSTGGSVTTVERASQEWAGVLSAADKAKLDRLQASNLASRTDLLSASNLGGIDHVRTAGYAVAGDGGGALYHRRDAEPTHAGKVQDAASGWWELVPEGPCNVRAFGARADGSDDTAAVQNACDFAGTVNNIAGPVAGSPTCGVYLPRGEYTLAKVVVAPGVTIFGDGPDATIIRAPSGHSDAVLDISRPASVPASRTRNYAVRDLTIVGSNAAGCRGIHLRQIAEVEISRVNIAQCDYGIDCPSDWVTGMIDRCKIVSNITRGIRLLDGSNGIHIRNTRVQATTSGANVEIDGGPTLQTLGNLLDNVIIESALDATNGQGILIGANYGAVATTMVGCYWENNKTHCVQIGTPSVNARSDVTIVGGQMSTGASSPYGVLNHGGFLSISGAYMDSIPASKQLAMEQAGSGAITPRMWNMTPYTPTGASAYAAIGSGGFGHFGNYYVAPGFEIADAANDYLRFVKRPNDVAVQGAKKYLWIQTELRTNWQGTALLSSGVVDVIFGTPAANASYAATLGSEGNNHLKISNKTIYGFRISAVDGAGTVQTGDSSRVHWHVFRNQ